MSNIPISSLPLAISLDGSETVPIVQGGTTKRATIDQFLTDIGLNIVRSDGGVSALGNVASFSNTDSTRITASPLYRSGNPGSAALYAKVANPAPSSTLHNVLQVSQGTPLPSGQQFGCNNNAVQQAIVGTISIPAGDTTTFQTAGVAGYAITNTPERGTNTGPGAVGVFGQGLTGVANADVFGASFIAVNTNGDQNSIGFDMNYMAGAEIDVLVWQKAGGVDPAITAGHVYGLTIAGSSNLAAKITNSSAVVVDRLSVQTNIPWDFGFSTYAGAAVNAIVAGPAHTGINQDSQYVAFQYSDGAGAPTIGAKIKGDFAGNLLLAPGAGAIAELQDGVGNPILYTSSTFGGGKVRISAFTTAGVVTNSVTTGELNSVTTLPSGLTIPGLTVTAPFTVTLGSDATGDVYYRNSGGVFNRLGIGSSGNVLTVAAGLPSWAAPGAAASVTVGTTTVSAGTTTRVLFDNAGVLGEYSITGTGNVAMSASPTFTGTVSSAAISNSGNISTATLNNIIFNNAVSTATVTFGSGKTIAINNSLTFTGTDSSSVAFGTGGTVAYTSNNLSVFASTTSAQLAGIISDETGSGALVFGTSPTIATPVINGLPTGTGVATANTVSTLVARNSSGDFSAGTITASLTGHASADLALAGGTMAGGITMGGNAIVGVSTVAGGSGTTGTQLTLQTTTGIGTTDAFAFKGGNNGATTFATLQTGSFNLQSGSTYSINGTSVLSGSTLGGGVTASSLTSVGTLTSGTAGTGFVVAGVTMTVGSDATGDVYYRNSGGVLTRLGIGSTGTVLTVAGGLPSWAAAGAAAAGSLTGTTLAANVVSSSLTSLGTITSLTATTINAFTLGGTIAGGGNQINNVIIGTSTPLAGTFTTLTASTSLTSPLHIGGSGTTGTQQTFQTTTGVGTTDAFAFKGGNNGASTFATLATTGMTVTGASPSVTVQSSGSTTTSAAATQTINATAAVNVAMLANDATRTTTRWGLTIGNWGEVVDFGTNGLVVGEFGNAPLVFGTNALERARISAAGGFSVGTTTDAGATNLLLAGILKYTAAVTAVSGAGPFLIGSASTLNSRFKVNMNGTDYWVPASTTAF